MTGKAIRVASVAGFLATSAHRWYDRRTHYDRRRATGLANDFSSILTQT